MTVSKNISVSKLQHVLFWILVACLWLYLRYQDYASITQASAVTAVKVVDMAAIIYLVNLWLVPQFLYRKKYLLFSLLFIALIALSSYLKMVTLSAILDESLANINVKEAIYNNFVTQFFLVLASIALKSALDYIQLQKKLAEVAKENAEAELNFLKAQINPHFLFNSLNAVYFLINKENTEARNALHKFSEMLRYQLYECSDSLIPIEKELQFLKDYVHLQKLRIDDKTGIEFKTIGMVSGFAIEPLLLIPFVENSFKHLSHFADGKENAVQIELSRQNGSMHFSVYNTTENKTEKNQSSGIGLTNVKRRLDLLYPGKHQLEIKEREGWFGVELSLSLDQ